MTLTKFFPSSVNISSTFAVTLLEHILFWKLLRGFKSTVETEMKATAFSTLRYSTNAKEKKIQTF